MGPRLKKPASVHGFVDRHGRPRFYLRRPGLKRVPLPGLPWSPEFMTAHDAAMRDEAAPAVEIGARRTQPGTLNELLVAFYTSPKFAGLEPITRSTYRGILERWRAKDGDK